MPMAAIAVAGVAASRKADVIILCCEINVLPPNPVSHAFHAGFGFNEVGRSADAEASKVVSYQLAEVSACATTVISEK